MAKTWRADEELSKQKWGLGDDVTARLAEKGLKTFQDVINKEKDNKKELENVVRTVCGGLRKPANFTQKVVNFILSIPQQKAEQDKFAKETMRETLEPYFMCPISHDIMADPVVASDGNTYEREEIMRALHDKGISPITRQAMDRNLTTNRIVKLVMETCEVSRGMF